MYPHIYEELAWAIAQEREEEVRKMRPNTEKRGESKLLLRSRPARNLAQARMRLGRTAGESASRAPANCCC